VSGRVRLEETGCEQAADLQDGQRDHAWFGRRGLIRGDRGGAWVSVRSFSRAAVIAQIATAAITSTAWRRIAA
jgi:hypothetical protein